MHGVITTVVFARHAARAGFSDEDQLRLEAFLAINPKAGDIIRGTGGARKLRFAAAGRGKSSGYRVITYYAADNIPVFLLDIYSKGERVNLSQSERNELRKILGTVADQYRQSGKAKVARIRR
jgi:hypothetical protein